MSFKEFIKPTFVKSLIALIFLFIPFVRLEVCSYIGKCFIKWHSAFSIFLESVNRQLGISILILILSITVSYIISCLIIYLINLIKKRT